MKKMILLVMLVSATAFAMSPKRKACLNKYQSGYEACRQECEEGPKNELQKCYAECGKALKELADACEKE